MERTWRHGPLTSRWSVEQTWPAADWAVVAFGVFLFWISASRPSLMPVWAPWDFSPLIYLATALTLLWFFRGVALAPPQERPPVWRRAVFVTGVLLAYAVLQTRFEYWSQHMFFLNRIQHVAMHHLSPFLIALSWVGGALKRGMPRWARRLVESRFAGAAIHVLQQPLLAAFLFVGLFYFWLIPAIYFRAMIDARLYALMNWSMVLDESCSGAWFSTRGRNRRRACPSAGGPPSRLPSCSRRFCLARSLSSRRATFTPITIFAAGSSPQSARSTISSSGGL